MVNQTLLNMESLEASLVNFEPRRESETPSIEDLLQMGHISMVPDYREFFKNVVKIEILHDDE